MSKTLDEKIQFRIELILALIITGLACCAGFSNLLLAPNDLYPGSTDFLGHMAKIQYITQCLKEGILPSWFPYWYCGTAVNQYYPPLSYYLMASIYALTDNVMLTFKISCFIALFTASMGVWYFCRVYIGRWCGLFGAVVFCLQPYILQTLFGQGQVAQGPVIALTPWYLIVILAYGQKPTVGKFALITLMCFLMILSHPNSIFMYCICIMIALAVFIPMKKITFQNYFYIGLTIVFAGVLSAFWSLIGVTGLENPTIPYLLGEAVKVFSATKDWFLVPTNFFYFAISTSIGSIMASLMFVYNISIKKTLRNESYYVLFCILLTGISIIFSFGLQIPLFKYLPMSESFVAGRILCLTSVSAAILCAYLIYSIKSLAYNKKIYMKLFASVICLTIMVTIVFYMNPIKAEYYIKSDDTFIELFSRINLDGMSFEKGRYSFIGAFDCSQTYFPLTYGLNMAEGYNIEGTPQNRALWGQIVANSSDNYDYMAKNLAFWNVRYLLLDSRYDEVQEGLNKGYTFLDMEKKDGFNFYSCLMPSSYFLIDKRNALIFGTGAPGVAIEFPYLIYEQRNDIFDYSLEDLEKYKLIYLCEPAVDTLQEKERIENMIEELINRGITIIIEPATSKSYSLFEVTAADMILENSPVLKKQHNDLLKSTAENISVEKSMNYARALFGLDKVYYQLVQNGGSLKNDIIGTKKVGNGEAIFIGMHLSQNLKGVYARNWGAPENGVFPNGSDEVKALLTDIFKTYGVKTDFWPDPFPVKNADWNYKGVDFEYSNPKAQEMTLSVTYTPRWKATLDGKSLEVGQKENLITLDLPAGNHKVKLVYGVTIYGIAGYVISLVGLLIFLLFIKFYDIIFINFRQICVKFSNFLQLVNND